MNCWGSLRKHEKVIESYSRERNMNNYSEKLSEIYNYVKSISDIFYDGKTTHDTYMILMEAIIKAERKFPNKKLIDVPIDLSVWPNKDNFIEFVVYLTRRYLIMENCFSYDYNINKINFTNDCQKAAEYIKQLCDSENIESYVLPIFPGYFEKARLFEGGKFHFANIIKYNNKYYLVDTTYSQFFYERQNNLDRLGVMHLSCCLPGVFMLMTESGKNIAKIILEKGYIELTEEIFKTYLDPFTISFRNGIYYENTGDFSYVVPYTTEDYIKFLNGEDSQLLHEGRENLGFQKRPLKTWNMRFK